MTGVLERAEPEAATPEPGAGAPLGRRRLLARLRADARVARRQAWRTRGSSLLVVLLVAMPVAGMVGGAVFWQSHLPTRAQEVRFELGGMAANIEIVGGEDPTRWQAVDSRNDWGVASDAEGRPVNPEKPAPEGPGAVVPAGRDVFEVSEYGSARIATQDGIASLEVTTGEVWDERFAGRYVMIDGRAPASADEAMATPGMLERLGLEIGDAVTLVDSDRSFTVTGTLRRADMRESDRQLFLPESAASLTEPGYRTWFVADWQPGLDELGDMNRAGFIVYARDLVLDPPANARTYQFRADTQQGVQMLLTGAVVAVFSGYLVVLLAGAAFAVAARRQQRSLAVAASVGASRGDVFLTVVLQGTVLGLIGGAAGAAAGIGLAAAAIAVTDQGAVNSFWGVWGFNVPWPVVLGILVFAVIVGTISAVAPARAATRGDVLAALRGSRRPVRLDTRRPVWGLVLLVAGVAATVAGALVTIALDAQRPVVYDDPMRLVAQFAIVIGPIVFQIGVLVAGHWIITVVARVVSRWGLAARVASRDAAANPSRVVPAFAAIAACVFLASFGLSAVALSTAGSARTYYWMAPLGSAAMNVWSTSDEGAEAATARAREIAEAAGADRIIEVWGPSQPEWDAKTDDFVDPEAPVYGIASQSNATCPGCGGPMELANGSWFAVADVGDVEALLQQDVPDDMLDAFVRGGAIVADAVALSSDGHVEITRWTTESQEAYYRSLEPLYERTDLTPEEIDAIVPDPDEVIRVAAQGIDADRQTSYGVLISPAAAKEAGIALSVTTVIALFDEPQPEGVYDRIIADSENAALGDGGINAWIERGPQPADPWLWLIAGATMVLVIGAGAVCLGLARFERRPDDATLTAVGGSRGVRRRINAWQAAIIVGIGSVVGTIAGQIPMWGIAQTTDALRYWADAPWLWLGLLAFGLPLVVTVVSWFVSPRHPDLTRRTAIA